MPWVKLTDVFPEDPKVEKVSHRAFRLHVTSLCYCARNLTDGRLTPKALKVVAASAGVATKTADELVDAGLWDKNGNGYVIPKYLEYNPSAEQVRKDREEARNRMRRVRGGGA